MKIDRKKVSVFSELTHTLITGSGRDQEGRPRALFTIEREGRIIEVEVFPRLTRINPVSGERFRLVGISPAHSLIIKGVEDSSPARRAGLRDGDTILSVDGEKLYSLASLIDHLGEKDSNPITLLFRRGSEEIEAELTAQQVAYTKPLGKLEVEDGSREAELKVQPIYPPDSVAVPTDPSTHSTLTVHEVRDPTGFVFGQLRAGDTVEMVNGKAVDSLESWVALIEGQPEGTLNIATRSGGRNETFPILGKAAASLVPPRERPMIGANFRSKRMITRVDPIEQFENIIVTHPSGPGKPLRSRLRCQHPQFERSSRHHPGHQRALEDRYPSRHLVRLPAEYQSGHYQPASHTRPRWGSHCLCHSGEAAEKGAAAEFGCCHSGHIHDPAFLSHDLRELFRRKALAGRPRNRKAAQIAEHSLYRTGFSKQIHRMMGESKAYCQSRYTARRRRTRTVMVGGVGVGGANPVRIQSMTTTPTQDVDGTVRQIISLVRAECEIVRVTAQSITAARALREIHRKVRRARIDVPLVADIHFLPNVAMEAANHVEKVRINPGNYADRKRFNVREYTDAQYNSELDRLYEEFSPNRKALQGVGPIDEDRDQPRFTLRPDHEPLWRCPPRHGRVGSRVHPNR